eukprot:6178946-Pyramimonas_sp.AAC.1
MTGADHVARLGGVGPDPVEVLAFRYASLTQDPDIDMERLDCDSPSDTELYAAHLDYDALRYAALCMDIGMRE